MLSPEEFFARFVETFNTQAEDPDSEIGLYYRSYRDQDKVSDAWTHSIGVFLARRITDNIEQVVFSADYKPFGQMYDVSGSERFTYTGKLLQEMLGLYYFGMRFYDSEVGRFITPDRIAGSLSLPQSLNQYVYVLNNPLKYVDPYGLFIHIVGGAIVGAIIGAAIYGYHWATTGQGSWVELGLAAGLGAATGAFVVATFGLGMVAFGVGVEGGIAVGSWAAVGAGIAVGGAVGAQTYYFTSTLSIATGMMSTRDLSMKDFALSVGLGMAFGAIGGKYYNPETYWGFPKWTNSPQQKILAGRYAGRTLDDVIAEAQACEEPFQAHHIRPIYPQGSKSGRTVSIPVSYHQDITNAFRSRFAYRGQKTYWGPYGDADVVRGMHEIYRLLPIPGGYP